MLRKEEIGGKINWNKYLLGRFIVLLFMSLYEFLLHGVLLEGMYQEILEILNGLRVCVSSECSKEVASLCRPLMSASSFGYSYRPVQTERICCLQATDYYWESPGF